MLIGDDRIKIISNVTCDKISHMNTLMYASNNLTQILSKKIEKSRIQMIIRKNNILFIEVTDLVCANSIFHCRKVVKDNMF